MGRVQKLACIGAPVGFSFGACRFIRFLIQGNILFRFSAHGGRKVLLPRQQ